MKTETQTTLDDFPFVLKGTVGSSYSSEPRDIRLVKSALNRLGLYKPDPNIGIVDFTDAAMFEGIKAFQKQKGLPVTGVIRTDSDTARALERAVEDVPFGQKYIWRTVQDDKVRSSHAVRNGQVFTEGNPPEGGHPGEEYNCRCWRESYNPILHDPARDAIEPVYPELLLLPFLRTGTPIKLAWQVWLGANKRDPEWRLGGKKSPDKWARQMERREWTPEKISVTIAKGKKSAAPNKVNKENTATRYEHDGKFVVRDDKTKEILQVSGDDFKPSQIQTKGGEK